MDTLPSEALSLTAAQKPQKLLMPPVCRFLYVFCLPTFQPSNLLPFYKFFNVKYRALNPEHFADFTDRA
jgi:hypothetical protein